MVNYDYVLKMIVIGDSNCGKTSLINRFANKEFPMCSTPTIGVDFATTKYTNNDGIVLKINVWDTAGQEKFRSIIQSYYIGIAGAVMVFDVTNRKSFVNIKYWLDELRSKSDDGVITPTLLIANKTDMDGQRVVSTSEGKRFATKYGIMYEEVSALKNINILKGFNELIDDIYTKFVVSGKMCNGVKTIHDIKISGLEDNKCCLIT
jgi:small GTP-binding protein